jgi:hypothetical protein
MAFSATTLTALQRAQVSANIEVAAEPCGILDSVNLKFDDKGAALGQVVVVPVLTPQPSTVGGATPSNVPPTGRANTPVNQQITITNVPEQSLTFTGEDLKLLDTMDSRSEVLKQWLAQAERAHRNEMDAAAATAISYGGSRAVGTVGTTPFLKDLSALTNARRILRKNGAPMSDVQVVTSVDAYTNLLNQNVIQKAHEAGSDAERRSGVIKSQFGLMATRESANITDHTAGAGTGYHVNGSGNPVAIGTTAIVVKSGSVNTTGIQIGDIIKFAGDTSNQYVVVPAPGSSTQLQTLTASNLLAAAGTIYIGNPGLRVAIADNAAITIVSSANTVTGVTGYSPSYAFERHCVVGIMRPPIQPTPSPFYTILDTVTDKFGYTYLFGEANQNFQVSWFLWVAYGFAVTQSEYVVPIIGN